MTDPLLEAQRVAAQALNAVTGGPFARGRGFTPTEDLLVCKAWMAASEDSNRGADQKVADFVETMHRKYLVLLDEQERVDWIKFNPGLTVPPNVPHTYDRRAGKKSILNRFKQAIAPRVVKLIGVHATTPVASGTNAEMHFKACREIYMKRYPKDGDPDTFKPCYNYLQHKPKFTAYREGTEDARKARGSVVGKKKAQRMKAEEELLNKVVEKVKSGHGNGSAANSQQTTTLSAPASILSNSNFVSTMEDAMTQWASSMKTKAIMQFLPTPEKKQMARLQASSMKLDTEIEIANKRRKLAQLQQPLGLSVNVPDSSSPSQRSGSNVDNSSLDVSE